MDAFFASIEQRDNPDFMGKPLVVGGKSKRSVVAAASYEARSFGIHSAMPMYKAINQCPNLIIVPPDKTKYRRDSKTIMDIFHEFTPIVEPVSIDEAFLDITGCRLIYGPVEVMARLIKESIKKELDLTCSIGAAPLKFLAKIASDLNKPDGIFIIKPHQLKDFIHNLSIKKIAGIGKKGVIKMDAMGINTVGDIKKFDKSLLIKSLGKIAHTLVNYADCMDDSKVKTRHKRKSVSSESTLEADTSDMQTIEKQLLYHSHRTGYELRGKGMTGAVISIKLKFSDFTQITRQKKLEKPTCSSATIYRESLALVKGLSLKKRIRLVGVGISSLVEKNRAVQLDLFEPIEKKEKKWDSVDKTVDAIVEKFGKESITKASLNKG